MRKILKVTSVLGIGTLVRVLAGVIRAKFLAWQIGPAGVGLVGQAVMYSTFTIQLSSLNMGMGITKKVSGAASGGGDDKTPLLVNTALTLQVAAALVFILLAIPFSGTLTKFIFSDQRYWPYFIGITLVTPFATYITGTADPVLYGLKKIPVYTAMMIAYTILGLALVFALVPFFKTEGMLLQVILFSVVGFAVSDFFLRKKASVRPALKLSLLKDSQSLAMSKQLFQYGLISFLPGTFSMVALLYLRGALMRQFGVEANGYFQVAYAMSAYYLPFVMNGIWGHFYPEMCALRSREEINREINQFVRFTLFASTAIAAGLIIFRRYVILMLYSGDFMSAYELLAIQGVGDIFFVLFCMFSTSLMARRKFKGVVFISAIGYNLFLVSSYFALTRMAGFGLTGLNLAIALTNIVFVAVYLAYYRWNTGFLPTRQNIRLFIKSALFLAVIYLIPDIDVLTVIAKVAISLLWLAVAMTREDAKGFAELIFFRGRAQND